MLTLYERLSRVVEFLPDGAAVTLPVETVREWLDAPASNATPPASQFNADLTVESIAAELNKAPSTVRAWFNQGIDGAYKLHGREWRISATDLHRYLRNTTPNGVGSSSSRRGTRMSDWKR